VVRWSAGPLFLTRGFRMARIYRTTDKIPVKIDDILIKISPLTVDHKAEIQSILLTAQLKKDVAGLIKGNKLAMKYAVKSMEGVEDSDGNAYKLEFDENNNLTDQCLDDLFNLEVTNKIVMVCANLLKKIPDEFTDTDGNKLEGVEIIKVGKPSPN
jgi:hypothetical protein